MVDYSDYYDYWEYGNKWDCDDDYSEKDYNELYGIIKALDQEVEKSTKRRCSKKNKKIERMRRNRVYKRHLRAIAKANSGWYPAAAWETVGYDGNPIIKRGYRGKASRYLKKECNRHFRHSSKFSMFSTKERSLYKKAKDFWWDLT